MRFEVPGVPGINEVQCNCPRCGTPFMAIPDVNKVKEKTIPQADEETSTPGGSEKAEQAVTKHNSPTGQATPPPVPPHNSSAIQMPPPVPPVFSEEMVQPETAARPLIDDRTKQKQRRWMRLLKAGFVAAVIALVVYYCSSDSDVSYTSDNVTLSNTADDSYDDDASPAPAYADSTEDETAPDWIQGTWHIDTDYGGITLKVHGSRVAETSAGETVYGSYRYQHHRLYCDFGAGDGNNDHVYNLNMSTKQIDAGQGLLMKKIE